MLSLLISVLFAAAAVIYCQQTGASQSWTVISGIVSFLAAMITTGLIMRRKINKVNADLQGILMGGQKRINKKIQAFQNKPNASPVLVQKLVEKEQTEFLEKALDFTKNLEPFCKWNLLMQKQIDTLRMQFNYQLKRFSEVDQIIENTSLLKGIMVMDPMIAAMEMARMYKNGKTAELEELFKKYSRKFTKKPNVAIIYALYSWALVKNGEHDKAREVLYQGKESTGNEILAKNWEALSNNKLKKFSNAGFGDEWFALFLENPPKVKQQFARGGKRGGFR